MMFVISPPVTFQDLTVYISKKKLFFINDLLVILYDYRPIVNIISDDCKNCIGLRVFVQTRLS